MKIAIYTIAKNEESNVDEWVEHGKEADYLVVLDTGSTDKTKKLLKEKGVIVGEKKIDPWRFDTARNEALKLVPEDTYICIAVDLDERIQPGWRRALMRDWKPDTELMNYWLHDRLWDDGTPSVEDWRCKIHKRHGFVWRRLVHEVPEREDGNTAKVDVSRGVVIKHLQGKGDAERDYLPILNYAIQEEPERAEYFTERAGEYAKKHEWELSQKDLETYLEMTRNMDDLNPLPKLQLSNARANAWINIANCKHKRGFPPQEVVKCLLNAVATCPESREAWTFLADGYRSVGNYYMAYGAGKTAESIKDSGVLTKNMTVWGDLPGQIAKEALTKII